MRQGVTSLRTFFTRLLRSTYTRSIGNRMPEGMHGFTGNDPQTFSGSQAIAPQQTFAAPGRRVSATSTRSASTSLAREIRNLPSARPALRRCRGMRRSSIRRVRFMFLVVPSPQLKIAPTVSLVVNVTVQLLGPVAVIGAVGAVVGPSTEGDTRFGRRGQGDGSSD